MTEAKPPAGARPRATDEADPAQIAQIEADIHQTRDAITGDLRALGERLSPGHLGGKAKEAMTEAKTAATGTLHEATNVATRTFRGVKGDATDSISEKLDELRDNVRSAEHEAVGFLRENAVPLALIGAGVAWLVSNRRSRDARWEGEYAPRDHGRWRYPQEPGYHPIDEARGARERFDDAAGRARDAAGRELKHARELSRHATDTHPLAVGAAALAAGVCVGLVLPETRREGELFGPRREQLIDHAKGAMRDARGAVQDLTHAAKETMRDVENGLSGATG